MRAVIARTYVALSGAILFVVGVVGFFHHEMFNLTFPPAHNVFISLAAQSLFGPGLESVLTDRGYSA